MVMFHSYVSLPEGIDGELNRAIFFWIKASLVPQSLNSCFWKDDRVHFQENKKSFVLINQKGIDPPSLEMLAHEAGIIYDHMDMSMICL